MPLNTISATDLMAKTLTPPPEVVSGIISVGYNILAGAPKAGKSWVSLGLALAVASGKKAFGQFDTSQGEVLYLALEDHEYRLKDRLSKITTHLGVPKGLHFCTDLPKLARGGIEDLHIHLHTNPGTKLVIIDTLGKVTEEKKGDLYQEDYMVGAALQAVAFEANCAVMVVHHTNKSPAGGLRQVSGTFGVSAAADAVLVLNRTNKEHEPPGAKMSVTGRDVDDKMLELEWYPPHGGWVLRGRKSEQTVAPWVRS